MKKAKKEPKTRCNNTMTESAFLAWVRSALRSKSLQWKPRAKALELARRPYVGPNKMQKWEYLCSLCNEWHLGKNCQVDHFPVPAGSILSVDDIGNFVNNLFCEVSNMRVLCKQCHTIHTHAEKTGISFVEASVDKEIIRLLKKENKKEMLALFSEHGYDGSTLTNPEKRRAALKEIFKGTLE